MNEKIFTQFSVSSRGKNKLFNDFKLMSWKFEKNDFYWNDSGSSLEKGLETTHSFARAVFLRGISESVLWAVTIALAWLPNKILK